MFKSNPISNFLYQKAYSKIVGREMSNIMRVSSFIQNLYARKPLFSPKSVIRAVSLVPSSKLYSGEIGVGLIGGGNTGGKVFLANYGEGSVQALENLPLSIELQPILSETQFDRVIAEAQQLEEPVLIVWMATWCRKCIYLKPKLEKLAADYYPRVQFYCVDVNNVSHKLVTRAGVTKMPTIQLWKDGEKQAEVIGGHKAHLVINEIREMIENEDAL